MWKRVLSRAVIKFALIDSVDIGYWTVPYANPGEIELAFDHMKLRVAPAQILGEKSETENVLCAK